MEIRRVWVLPIKKGRLGAPVGALGGAVAQPLSKIPAVPPRKSRRSMDMVIPLWWLWCLRK